MELYIDYVIPRKITYDLSYISFYCYVVFLFSLLEFTITSFLHLFFFFFSWKVLYFIYPQHGGREGPAARACYHNQPRAPDW